MLNPVLPVASCVTVGKMGTVRNVDKAGQVPIYNAWPTVGAEWNVAEDSYRTKILGSSMQNKGFESNSKRNDSHENALKIM